jgi:CheY-like chemotaxis protein
MLQEAGYCAVELSDGHEAWSYVRRADVHIDAILCDVVMPGITGTELVARLQSTHPEIPVVLMSAYSAEELRARGLDASPVPLLTKPFEYAPPRLAGAVGVRRACGPPYGQVTDRHLSARLSHRAGRLPEPG